MSTLDVAGLLLVAVVWGVNFAVVKAGLGEFCLELHSTKARDTWIAGSTWRCSG